MLLAQNTSSGLSGTVQDASGATIAGANVILTGEENGFVRKAVSSREGFFSFPDLTRATFTLVVDAPGFKAVGPINWAQTAEVRITR